jgi:hypothetical protein
MKRNILPYAGSWLLMIASLTVFLVACKTSSVSMEVLVPAQITVPQHIKKVAVVNRSLPAKKELFYNILEGFFTGESIMGDREGSDNCIKGLANKLNVNPRMGAVVVSGHDLRGTGTREFPVPLDWGEVQKLCTEYQADALICLETFDSDVWFNKGMQQIKSKTKGDKDTIINKFVAELKMNVNSGWRIYDPTTKKIVDENSFMDEKGFKGEGVNEGEAMSKIPNKRDAINTSGIFSGEMFGIRISPNWLWVSRSYYIRGDKGKQFKVAKKMVKKKNWDGASQIWTKLSKDPTPKVAGRACFNLALASEMDGKLKDGLDWANKAYKNFNLRAAGYYVNTLNRRIMDQDKLKEQMGK